MKTGQRESLSFCAAHKEYLIIANHNLVLLILDALSPRDHVANLKKKTLGGTKFLFLGRGLKFFLS